MAYRNFTNNVYFNGTGKVFVGLRNSDGTKGMAKFVGNAPAFELSMELDKEEVKDSTEPGQLVDLVLIKERKATLKLTLYSVHSDNLALMVGGTKVTISSGSVTGEAIQAVTGGGALAVAIAAGDLFKTKQENISAVAINRGATPLVLDTDYRIVDAGFGQIEFLTSQSVGASALTINYSYATREQVVMFNAAQVERYVEYHVKNVANSNKKFLFEFYRCQFDPAKTLPLLTNEAAKIELEIVVLNDSTRVTDANLGGFGRTSFVDAQVTT